jgi:hypothetical protein
LPLPNTKQKSEAFVRQGLPICFFCGAGQEQLSPLKW